jgi:hypothetical protein
MNDLRDDFWKFMDAIKPMVTFQEWMDIVDKNTKKELMDILRKCGREDERKQ